MKTQKMRRTFSIFILFLVGFFGLTAGAANFPRAKLNARYNSFSGEKSKAFAPSSPRLSGGITIYQDRSRFVPFLGLNYEVIKARQVFNDGDTTISSSFAYESITAELGLNFYPIARQQKGVNFFMSAAGIVGFQSLKMSPTHTFNTIPYFDTGISRGARAGLGVEWLLKNSVYLNHARWVFDAEVGFKKESTELHEQNFSLDAAYFSLGFGW